MRSTVCQFWFTTSVFISLSGKFQTIQSAEQHKWIAADKPHELDANLCDARQVFLYFLEILILKCFFFCWWKKIVLKFQFSEWNLNLIFVSSIRFRKKKTEGYQILVPAGCVFIYILLFVFFLIFIWFSVLFFYFNVYVYIYTNMVYFGNSSNISNNTYIYSVEFDLQILCIDCLLFIFIFLYIF